MRFSECLADYHSRVYPRIELRTTERAAKVKGFLERFSDEEIKISQRDQSNSSTIPTSEIAELEIIFHTTENPGGGEADGSGNEHCLMEVTYHHKLTRDDSPGGWHVENLTTGR